MQLRQLGAFQVLDPTQAPLLLQQRQGRAQHLQMFVRVRGVGCRRIAAAAQASTAAAATAPAAVTARVREPQERRMMAVSMAATKAAMSLAAYRPQIT